MFFMRFCHVSGGFAVLRVRFCRVFGGFSVFRIRFAVFLVSFGRASSAVLLYFSHVFFLRSNTTGMLHVDQNMSTFN